MDEGEYISAFLDDAVTIINQPDRTHILKMSYLLQERRRNGGRLFIFGGGGVRYMIKEDLQGAMDRTVRNG